VKPKTIGLPKIGRDIWENYGKREIMGHYGKLWEIMENCGKLWKIM